MNKLFSTLLNGMPVKFLGIMLLLYFLSFTVNAQSQQVYTTDEGIEFLVYLPEAYTPTDEPLPLMVFLHGLGEKGEDIETVKRYGPPHLIESGSWSKDLPFVVISPQLPGKYGYWPDFIINHIIAYAEANYNIDEQRVYLTGLSLGGMGTWNYALHQPEKLAAIIPICGKADPALACNLGKLPVWAFHGDQDGIVFPEGSIKMIEALRNCEDRTINNTKFTLYPGVKHDSWTITYNNPEIYEWLLSFKNEKVAPKEMQKVPVTETTTVKESNSPTLTPLREICKLPVAVVEISGLEYYKNGSLWAHNDSGDLPVLYEIDTTGKIIQIKRITKAANFDWEDITQDEGGNLYIGDFGNNNNNRKSLQIYKIPNPKNAAEERISAELIEFIYPDQHAFPPKDHQLNFDMEAMVAYKDHLYLFSKNRTQPFSGYVKLYRLPTTPGSYTAELIDSIYLDNGSMIENWITGADISPDNETIALLSSSKVWLLRNFEEDNFFKGDMIPILLPHLTQKEGITFLNNTEILISDERFKNFLGGKLYHLNISSFLGE